jgi:hypothetical protein
MALRKRRIRGQRSEWVVLIWGKKTAKERDGGCRERVKQEQVRRKKRRQFAIDYRQAVVAFLEPE